MQTTNDVIENQQLDSDEQALEDSIANGEWKSVDNLAEEKQIAQEAAIKTFRQKEESKTSQDA